MAPMISSELSDLFEPVVVAGGSFGLERGGIDGVGVRRSLAKFNMTFLVVSCSQFFYRRLRASAASSTAWFRLRASARLPRPWTGKGQYTLRRRAGFEACL